MGPRKKPSNGSSGGVSTPQAKDIKTRRDLNLDPEELMFAKEYWTGSSRDGVLEDGDGYHYYRMTKSGKILEAYEFYELDDGRECVAPLPEMLNIHWINDLGFDDFEALDMIKEIEFSRIKDMTTSF